MDLAVACPGLAGSEGVFGGVGGERSEAGVGGRERVVWCTPTYWDRTCLHLCPCKSSADSPGNTEANN